MNRITKLTTLIAVAFAMFGGATAYAQSPADEVYNPNGGVLDVVTSGTPTPAPTATVAPTTDTAPETDTDTPEAETPAAPAEETSTPVATATPSAPTQQATTGNLPFTGFEAGFVALAGAALLAGGFAMRRASRTES